MLINLHYAEGTYLWLVNEDELTKLCYALIDFEALLQTISQTIACELLQKMVFEAFKKLTNAINMVRFSIQSQPNNSVSKHLDNLYIDSKYAYNLDNPSIKAV